MESINECDLPLLLVVKPYLSGFVSQLGGGFRRSNIRRMKPMVGRKVVITFSVAQAQKKYSLSVSFVYKCNLPCI